VSDEETLAREAIAEIRAWNDRWRKARGENSTPRLAIKFCGGCNPYIERGLIAHKIREGLLGLVSWIPPEEGADLLLIINGCLAACADRPEVKEKSSDFLIIRGKTISKSRKAHSESKTFGEEIWSER